MKKNHSQWTGYRALMDRWLIGAEKNLGIRPVGVGGGMAEDFGKIILLEYGIKDK